MEKQLLETIERYDTIIIARHVRPDPDAYGSQVGLKMILAHNYPEKQIYAVGQHEESLSFLATQDDIAREAYKNALVIVTDTANTDRIDSPYYDEAAYLVKIDHHPNEEPYGDEVYVDTSASSTSELIYQLYEKGAKEKGWTFPPEAARLLYAGIVGDTGRFLFPSTTNETFRVAGELIRYPFDRSALYDAMYEMSRKLLQLQGYLYQHFVMDENGAAYVKVDRTILERFGVTANETSQLVGALGHVKGICAWAMFVEESDSYIRVRLRSKGPTINTIAAKYNGGGHRLASGASIHRWEEADAVIQDIQTVCQQYSQ